MPLELPTPHHPALRALYLWVGILSTVCYRAIIVLEGASAFWLKAAWYAGTVGFIVYFAHRYQISRRRERLVEDLSLDTKAPALPGLSPDERDALAYVLGTLRTSREHWNYIAIFASSLLALGYGAWHDFLPLLLRQ